MVPSPFSSGVLTVLDSLLSLGASLLPSSKHPAGLVLPQQMDIYKPGRWLHPYGEAVLDQRNNGHEQTAPGPPHRRCSRWSSRHPHPLAKLARWLAGSLPQFHLPPRPPRSFPTCRHGCTCRVTADGAAD